MPMKLGPYLEFFSDSDPRDPIDAWIDSGGKSLKVEGSLALTGYAAERLAGKPNAFVVGRDIPRFEEIMAGVAPSAGAAESWWAQVGPLVRDLPRSIFWEDGYNELGSFEDPAVRQSFCAYELRRGQLMNARGFHCCYLNISAETTLLLFRYLTDFLPLFEQAYQNDDLIGLHAYFSPRFYDRVTGQMDPLAEPFLFPERTITRALQRRGLHVPMFFNSEGKAIDTNLHLGRFYDGWRTVPGASPEDMADQLRWAEQQVHADPFYAGGAVYIYDKAEQPDKVMYNIATGEPGRGKDHPPQPSVFELMVAMNGQFGEGLYCAPAGSTPPEPPPGTPEPPPPAAASGVYRVSTGSAGRLRLRRAPVSGEVVGLQVSGSELVVEDVRDGWAKLKGVELYASAQYLVKIEQG